MPVHPWRRLRELAHVTLLWHDGGLMGEADHDDQTISLRRGMTYEQRRVTVLHECLHLTRGAVPYGMLSKEEEQVSKETARLLLPDIRGIADALAWSQNAVDAAEELAVDTETLLVRLRHLHPFELGYMKRRFDD